jgi:hypothetical protein
MHDAPEMGNAAGRRRRIPLTVPPPEAQRSRAGTDYKIKGGRLCSSSSASTRAGEVARRVGEGLVPVLTKLPDFRA